MGLTLSEAVGERALMLLFFVIALVLLVVMALGVEAATEVVVTALEAEGEVKAELGFTGVFPADEVTELFLLRFFECLRTEFRSKCCLRNVASVSVSLTVVTSEVAFNAVFETSTPLSCVGLGVLFLFPQFDALKT